MTVTNRPVERLIVVGHDSPVVEVKALFLVALVHRIRDNNYDGIARPAAVIDRARESLESLIVSGVLSVSAT